MATVWERRGDSWAQVAAAVLALVVPWVAAETTGSPGNLRLTLVQAGVVALACAVAYVLGRLPGALKARNQLLGVSAALATVATAVGHPGVGQLAALVPILLGAGVSIGAPHPDDVPQAPNPWQAAREAEKTRTMLAVFDDRQGPDGGPAAIVAHPYPAGADTSTIRIARLPNAAPW